MKKENEKIIMLDSHKIVLSVNFLLVEEKECFTDFGRGMVEGLMDSSGNHKMPVVHVSEYDKVVKENSALILAGTKVNDDLNTKLSKAHSDIIRLVTSNDDLLKFNAELLVDVNDAKQTISRLKEKLNGKWWAW